MMKKKSENISGFVIAGFVLSLLSLLFFWFAFIGILFLVLAVIFLIIGIRKSSRKGLAIAGLIISAIALVLIILVIVNSQGPKPPYHWYEGPSGHLWYDTEGFTLNDCLKMCEIPYYVNAGNLSTCQTTCNNLAENSTALDNYVLEVRVIAKKVFAKTNPAYGSM